jgi:aminoglycoside 3-N-acetyltransferase
MPRPEHIATRTPVTRSRLTADLRRLGLQPGIAMVHGSLSSLGWVVGGSQTVVEALLDRLGPHGTLCAQVSWEDIPFGQAAWPDDWRDAYEAELPPFDPVLSAAAPYEGRLAERIRTWPGGHRSANPGTGIAAIGAAAADLIAEHRLDDGFGHGTPYARLVERDAQIVLLGAPLRTISLLHHAEAIACVPKRWTTYRLPVAGRGWVAIREIDVWHGVYADTDLGAIAAAALDAGIGRRGAVGQATAHLFGARELTRFAVGWLEEHYASGRSSQSCHEMSRPGQRTA